MSTKSHFLLILFSLLIFLTLSCKKEVKSNWDSFVNNFVESYFKQNPERAAYNGRHEYDGQISDYSDKGIKDKVKWFKKQKELTEDFSNTSLTSEQILEKENLLRVIDENIFFMEVLRKPYYNSDYYYWQLAPSNYLEKNYAPLDQRMKSYIEYLKSMKIAVEQIQNNFKNEPAISRYYLEIAKEEFGGFADFMKNDAPKGFAKVKDEKLWDEFNKATNETVDKLNSFVEWLSTQMPEASENFAMGAEKFSQMLYATDRLNIPLKELRKVAEDDLDRNLSGIKAACQKMFPGKSVKECIEILSAQKKDYDPVTKANEQLPILKKFLEHNNIVSIPHYRKLSVVKAPPFMAVSAAINQPSAFDKELEGFYYVSNPDWPEKLHLSLYSEMISFFDSIHEVWPGHFLQALYYHDSNSLLSKIFLNYTCLEGWAHYTEEMMYDKGFGNYKPEYEIAMRLCALTRNVRFLAAVKMHTEGMTVKQAEEFFKKNAFYGPEEGADQEALRGTYDPQYYGYTLGKLFIRKLKNDWMAKTKSSDLKEFHTKFLSYGVIPIPLIEKSMMAEN